MGANAIAKVFYNFIAPIYDFFFGPFTPGVLSMRRRLVEKMELQEGSSVLEICIGTGANLPLIHEKIGKRGRIDGIDISDGMLERCRERARKEGMEVELREGKAEELPYKNNSFDSVLNFGGINFFDNRRKAVGEMMRVAKPGAKIVVGDEHTPLFDLEKEVLELLPAEAVRARLSYEKILIFGFWVLEFRKKG
jgi:ubiquinone/menaquinone biosynthesis C-methylase UbiE